MNIANIPLEKVDLDVSRLDPFNKIDEYSEFRWHMRNIKRRDKECNITLQDLKDQWEKQKGICPYTGWEMKQIKNTGKTHQLPLTPDRASLDRIDNSKGYIKGNVQFVAAIAQYAKYVWGDKELLNFCEAVMCKKALDAPYHLKSGDESDMIKIGRTR